MFWAMGKDLVSGGGHPFQAGGADPLFFASDPKSQGSPLMYFWLPPDFGGGADPHPPPGYALGYGGSDFGSAMALCSHEKTS